MIMTTLSSIKYRIGFFALLLFLFGCAHHRHESAQNHQDAALSSRDIASRAAYTQSCADLISVFINQPQIQRQSRTFTRLELELGADVHSEQLPLATRLQRLIDQMEQQDSASALLARRAYSLYQQRGARALRVDTSELTQKMVRFLEGPFAGAHGQKALYGPFVDFRLVDNDTLLIHHLEDIYPIIVRWDDVLSPEVSVRAPDFISGLEFSHPINGFQVLTLPRDMTSASALNRLTPEVFNVSAASRFHPFKWEQSALTARFRSLLHDQTEFYLRPTQREFSELRELLNTNREVRQRVNSLLFVAPTGAGKTRVLGLGVIDKVEQTLRAISTDNARNKKLSIVMANNANLVDQLGREIGTQVSDHTGFSRVRIVQWGGSNSEQMSLQQLNQLIDNSEVPVVLVSTFQTVASRVRQDSGLRELMSRTNLVAIDEAHNSTGNTYKRVMSIAREVAQEDRQSAHTIDSALDIIGVTATPSSRSNPIRTVDLFDYTYRAGEMTPGVFSYRVQNLAPGSRSFVKNDMLEWYSVERQRRIATQRGEINSPEEFTYMNLDRSLFFTQGSHPRVSTTRLESEWPNILPELNVRAPGIIHTYPRDAANVAETLSRLTGKNYVSDAGMTVRQRDQLYQAFKNGEEFNGQRIDALIIGRMKLEGLDFPQAGWFVSLKRYSYFPDNIQEAGRAMRLAHDKPTPAIIFYAENTGSSVYAAVRDFVMRKMGRLPRSLAQGRGFTGARRYENSYPNSILGEKSLDLNVALELVFRQNPEIARDFTRGGELQQNAVEQFHQVLSSLMRRHGNAEASRSLREFSNEVNSLPFFKGTLRETWNYCDRLIRMERTGNLPSTVTDFDRFILSREDLMDQVREFREMRNWIGNVGRDIIETIDLQPRGVYDMANVLDSFVRRFGEDSVDLLERAPFRADLDNMLNVSGPTLWNRLGFAARVELDILFRQSDELPFEQGLNQYFLNHQALPDFYFAKLSSEEVINMQDKISHRLAKRLQARIQTGRINFEDLSDEVIVALDRSPFFYRIVGHATAALENELERFVQRGAGARPNLNFNDLLGDQGIGVYRILNYLADQGYDNAVESKRAIEYLLSNSQ